MATCGASRCGQDLDLDHGQHSGEVPMQCKRDCRAHSYEQSYQSSNEDDSIDNKP